MNKTTLIGTSILFVFGLLLAGFPMLSTIMDQETAKVQTSQPLNPFFLTDRSSDAVLVYFGYVGCTSVCIPALEEFAPVYSNLAKRFPSLEFYFVNLDPSQSPEWVDPFARYFHPQFKGIYASMDQINALERDFNLARSGTETIKHSSNLYLLVRQNGQYVLKRIYITHPYPETEIIHDLAELA